MTVTMIAISVCRSWPWSSTVMMDRRPPLTTTLKASSAPRWVVGRLASSQSRPMTELAQRCPRATGPRTTAMNGAPPMSVRLASRKR